MKSDLRIEDGVICCCAYDDNGNPIAPTYPCDKCKQYFATAESESFAPPDPWARDLAAMRAASATQLATFEAQYKAERTREFERTRAALDAERPQDGV